jgi:predicted nucleic acid-binding protein
MNAVDTNVLVYALDGDERVKHAKAREFISRALQSPTETVLLWQVAGELLSTLRKWESAGYIAAVDVEANLRDVLSMFPLRVPTVTIFELACDLHARFSLSHWDSMLLAACKDAGITTLYSDDCQPVCLSYRCGRTGRTSITRFSKRWPPRDRLQ